jgi:putative ABC transport system substrate-binding protein
VRRREFITLLGGAAATATGLRPASVSAQQGGRTRRVAVLIGYSESDSLTRARVDALVRGLEASGWTEGRNIRLDFRYSGGSVERARSHVEELLDLKPDAILANTTPVTVEFSRRTKSIPIVFAVVSDPVGSGLVASLARPGGNVTGFINVEGAMGGKWVELLKDLSPGLSRVAMMFNPDTAPYAEYYQDAFRVAAAAFSVEATIAPVRSRSEIEETVTRLAASPGAGLIAIPDSFLLVNRAAIVDATLRHRLPVVFGFAESGGLLEYATDTEDLFRRAASDLDRILRGASPSDLPVQMPTKFSLVVNLKAARTIGLTVPPMLLARADEVIE